ncbi:ABC transporter permease [Pseudomarimonas arenosa]|uniref:ABC transporter permease n=1 Tax=Pseudomarimonas arenosa TaxID=2774145 RepID=A0AAW3ZQR8_9GAMM|nr:ABC transporter permease [Pseudomarimonas arenosa]MBD8528068.1 ABC transporter permease [Pseudomarimonas arenosa]
MSTLWFELKMAWRSLQRTPGFTLSAALMLCAGLAVCMYVFGAIQSFLMRPLPLNQPERLLHMEYTPLDNVPMSVEIGIRTFIDLEREQTQLNQLSGYHGGTLNLSDDDTRPERYNGAFVIGDMFAAYGVPAMLGRYLQPADQASEAEPTVLLGYSIWQQRYAADPAIIGRLIRVNGRPARVVGVMPNGFRFPFDNQVWVPIIRKTPDYPRDQDPTLEVFGRLKDGATQASVSEEMNALIGRIRQAHPDSVPATSVVIKPYQEEFVGSNTKKILWTMFAAVVFVLLIACANVANLLFARAAGRTRDIAVRSSLGATRARLAMGMVAESLILSFIAVIPAVLLAHWAGELTMEALRSGDDPPPFWMTESHFDWLFAACAVALAVLAGVVAGLLPGLRLARGSAAQVIRDGSASLTAGSTSKVLVVAEVAMSLALLVATGLMVRGILNLEQFDIGARSEGLVTARYGLFETQAADDAALRQHQRRVLEAMQKMPAVQGATLTTALPMANTGFTSWYSPEGEVIAEPQRTPMAYDVRVDQGFFELFQIGLQSGRLFDTRDRADSLPVAVISRALAERHWPGQDPLGKRLRMERYDRNEAPWVTVIGVVGEVAYDGEAIAQSRDGALRPAVYRPMDQAPSRFVSIAVAGSGDEQAVADAMREAMRQVDADTPLYWVRSLQSWIDGAATDHRIVGTIFSMFGVFSLALASAGLYAVLAFAVAQRTREIGVRRALGATARDILRMVVGQGAGQVALGLLLGLPLALGFGFALQDILYNVSSADPLTYIVVFGVFGLVALSASALPGRRALRVEPSEALRYG